MNSIHRIYELISALDADVITNAPTLETKLQLLRENSAHIQELTDLLETLEKDVNDMTFLEYYQSPAAYRSLQKLVSLTSLPQRSLPEIIDLFASLRQYENNSPQEAVVENLN